MDIELRRRVWHMWGMHMKSQTLLGVVSAAFALSACGNDMTETTGTSTTVATTTVSGTTTDTSAGPTTDMTNPTSTSSPTSSGTMGNTDGMTSTTTDATSTSTTTDATGSTGAVSASTSTTGSSTSGSSGMACACTPGDTMGCQGDQILVCAEDCSGFVAEDCPGALEKCKGDACVAPLCQPGQTQCMGIDQFQVCNGNGDGFDPPQPCGNTQECSGNACIELCDLVQQSPSSVGCSFFAQKMDNFNDGQPDSLIVGNTHPTKSASVQLYFVPNGQNVEQAQGAPQVIAPGKTYTFQLTNAAMDKISVLRKGGVYRVQSNIPIVAYLHSPLGAQATNDASMLLPEYALKQNYYIASWKDGHNAYPSYFNVIALEDGTKVSWTPPQNTVAGNGVPAVNANATGNVMLNRYDTLQVRAPNGGDLTGTFVSADKPIWVVGAVECVNVPTVNVTFCDHIEEQMLPLDYWGKTYVGAHSPKRGNEKHYWRVFAGEDNVQVTTNPAQPGTPFTLNKGQWKDMTIANNTSFMFNCSGPCLPVQYLEGQNGGAGTGDPAMYQMIPVEQFLERYAFATGTGYASDYVQVIRSKGGPDVLVDGVVVNGYYAVDQYEVADWKIAPGGHFAESTMPFGIVSVGYTGVTSYAYPGGMRLQVINPQ